MNAAKPPTVHVRKRDGSLQPYDGAESPPP